MTNARAFQLNAHQTCILWPGDNIVFRGNPRLTAGTRVGVLCARALYRIRERSLRSDGFACIDAPLSWHAYAHR